MDDALLLLIGGVGSFSLFLLIICAIVLLVKTRKDGTLPATGGDDVVGDGDDDRMTDGDFKFTNYWVASTGDDYLLDCGSSKPKKKESVEQHRKEVTLGSAPGGRKYDLKGKDGSSLAKVDAYTWDACYCEGTCRLDNGMTYNLLSENKQTFMKTDAEYGLGSKGQRLVPFVSVTADGSFPHGTTLMVKNMVGAILPNGEIHNGCIRVDDNCGDGCGKNQLDLHVGTYSNYKKLNGRLQGNSDIDKKSCEVLEY